MSTNVVVVEVTDQLNNCSCAAARYKFAVGIDPTQIERGLHSDAIHQVRAANAFWDTARYRVRVLSVAEEDGEMKHGQVDSVN